MRYSRHTYRDKPGIYFDLSIRFGIIGYLKPGSNGQETAFELLRLPQ